jgi:hypothetical protein
MHGKEALPKVKWPASFENRRETSKKIKMFFFAKLPGEPRILL